MNILVRSVDRMTGAVGVIGAWMVAPLMLATCYEIFSRYALNRPTNWAFELGYMLTGANFMLGMAFALREKAHIRIEVLYMHFPARFQVLVDTFTYVVIIIPLCSWMSWGLYQYAIEAYLYRETSGMSSWNPLLWPIRAIWAVAFFMLTLQAVVEVIKCIMAFGGKHHMEENDNNIRSSNSTNTESV